MQEERERWQKEKASLCAEVEQLRKGTEGAGLTSPLEQRVKSPSPDDEEESLERSMIKVISHALCVSCKSPLAIK